MYSILQYCTYYQSQRFEEGRPNKLPIRWALERSNRAGHTRGGIKVAIILERFMKMARVWLSFEKFFDKIL